MDEEVDVSGEASEGSMEESLDMAGGSDRGERRGRMSCAPAGQPTLQVQWRCEVPYHGELQW